MLIVGDIHGKIFEYVRLLQRFQGEPSVQIGDFGFGFVSVPKLLPADAWFFRGNHDSPELVRKSAHNLGEYGIREIDGVKFFFVAGAWSIDFHMRKEGVSWWRDEELSITQLNDAVDLYTREKPEIVLSHDGPEQATRALPLHLLHKLNTIPTRTGQALSAMYEAHQPEQWIFGHWHLNWKQKIGNTDFRCLPELGFCQIAAEDGDEEKAA